MTDIVIIPPTQPAFESRLPYNAHRIHAAAIYCSDGRFGAHCDDFLNNGLNLPRYDRLVVPGGPAALAGHFITYRESEALAQQIEFLINAHGLERVVLIGHEGCAFYSQKLSTPPDHVVSQQRTDLCKAARRLSGMSSRLVVDAHMAWRREDRIVFDRVPLDCQAPLCAPAPAERK
jgi:hypothetical protein